jgi:hypothetical protein
MTTQGQFWGPSNTSTRQARLFDDDGPRESDLSCGQCGRPLIHTPSGYLSCSAGCGKLLELTEAEPCGAWFEPDLFGEE